MAGRWREAMLPVLGAALCAGAVLSPRLAREARAELEAPVRRLILTDGSYELIRDYTVENGRVRYYSTERHEWEELPEGMVDWEATERRASRANDYAGERDYGDATADVEDGEDDEDARRPLVAPGLRMPMETGVFLLDAFEGRQALSPLAQGGTDTNRNLKGNILRGIFNPVASSRQTLELDGLAARTQAHTGTPEIFVSVDPPRRADSPAKSDEGADGGVGYTGMTAREHLRLVRCGRKDGKRTVLTYNIAVYGKVTPKAEEVAIVVEPVSSRWVKVRPAAPLPTGEYALVEWGPDNAVNELVWDFGVNPSAPPNAAVGGSPGPAPTGPPVLIERGRDE
ncbi:MAG: hypothetical protein LBT74_04685 [Acidobacteriota bacterium]|nr:hypothetical protein [Acidobacteriota bacterium]